jgi:hypothetical protein
MAININSMKGAMGAGLGQIGQASVSATGVVGAVNNGGYAVHTNGALAPINPSFGDLWSDSNDGVIKVYTQQGWEPVSGSVSAASINAINPGNLTYGSATQSISVAQSPTTSVIAIETKVGRVGINIETGDITIPPGIGRDVAAREFWLGFQEHFRPANTAKYEKEIEGLKRDLAGAKASAVLMKQENMKEASKRVAEKIRKKYNGEKFIMVKPEDLIRFIEET